jgi:hypothetical protein
MSKRQLKPDISEDKMGLNPFIDTLEIPVVRRGISNQLKRIDNKLIPAEFDHELTSHAKLFCDPDKRYLNNSLSLRAKELLLWVMFQTTSSKDYIWINKTMYMEENNVTSINTYKEALADLIKKKYLGITLIKDVYWINPKYFFKGDRVKKYPNNVLTRYNYGQ